MVNGEYQAVVQDEAVHALSHATQAECVRCWLCTHLRLSQCDFFPVGERLCMCWHPQMVVAVVAGVVAL